MAEAPNNALHEELTKAIAKGVPTAIRDSTIAIVGANAPAVRHLGSGTLVRVADEKFVVTAGHVIRTGSEWKATLGVSVGASGNFIAMPESWILSSGVTNRSGKDTYDIAVCRLNEEQVAKLGGQTFLRLSDISFSEDVSHGYFLVSGFPQIWSTACDQQADTMKLRLLHLSTSAYDGDTAGLDSYNRRYHILLNAKHDDFVDESGENIRFRMRSGASARLPNDIQGMSGCSVWQIGDVRIPADHWHADQVKLIAVETSVYPNRSIIKATRWVAVTTLLYTAFPELRPVIDLHASL